MEMCNGVLTIVRAGFSGGNDPDNREPFFSSGYETDSVSWTIRWIWEAHHPQDMYLFFQSLNAARTAAAEASSSFYTDQVSCCPVAPARNRLTNHKQRVANLCSRCRFQP